MGRMTRVVPPPNSLSSRSCRKTMSGEPSAFDLSFMPWSPLTPTTAPSAALGEPGENAVGSQKLRPVHHRFLAGGRIEKEVPGDAMHGRRHAGDDRDVVRIGEAGHHVE